MSVIEDTDLHPRALKRHYIEVDGAKWEVSTVRLIEEPEDVLEFVGFIRDIADGIDEKYETMVFKLVDDMRYSEYGYGATSFGHYRSNSSEDIVKAHDQIVSLIAEGKLIPVCDRDSEAETVSTNVLKAMATGVIGP